ncbi:site-specific integrase [Streptomyces niveus]
MIIAVFAAFAGTFATASAFWYGRRMPQRRRIGYAPFCVRSACCCRPCCVVGVCVLSEWSLFWVGGGGTPSLSDGLSLGSWSGLPEREQALGFRDRQPILVDPRGRVDPRLVGFFRRSWFSTRSFGTQDAYVRDYRLFFTFLWQAGRSWDQARIEDLANWEHWRLRGEGNPARIGGAKWQRELAALRGLYDWAAAREIVDASPVALRSVRTRDGGVVQVPELAPSDVRSSDVKWLTPRAYRLWRDVGLRGRRPDGRVDTAWRGRNEGRDVAFADTSFSSGLRRREAGSLLTVELPELEVGRRYYPGRVGRAVAKRAGRYFYVAHEALKAVESYRLTARAAAVRRAQKRGWYERIADLRVVEHVGRRGEIVWTERGGRTGRAHLGELDARVRRLLYRRGEAGLEPLAVWLTETGMPLKYTSWNQVFERANARCLVLGLTVFATPHMLRHSMALRVLLSLHFALDRRLGLSPEQRRDYEELYGNVWAIVKDLLGHRSEETTREIYLEPLRGLQLETLLSDDAPESTEVLARLAQRTGLVLDVPVGAWV